jgi:integral membrane protein (TIGR00529 family)
MGLGPVDLFQSAIISTTRLQTISLALIVGLIMVMSQIMEESGHMERLVKSFARLSKDARKVGAVMSALIGLLPMPGGALFSAPIVETSLSNHTIKGEQKTALNYWFRHIWEYWWPLYPGVILAVALLEVETWHYMAMMAPMTLVSTIAGVVFILKSIVKVEGQHMGDLSWPKVREFIWEMMPILVVIFMIVVMAGLVSFLGFLGFSMKIPAALSILPGLLASIIWVCLVNHIPFRQFRSAFVGKRILPMLLLIMAIMVFKGIMADSQAVVHVRNELMAHKIPIMLIILIMPFLSGIITGIGIGFVGTSFPLIIPLFQTPHLLDYLSVAALAYTFGFMGMMLSPVHLCFLVTKDYFKVSLLNSYQYIIKPILMVTIVAVVLFSLIRAF